MTNKMNMSRISLITGSALFALFISLIATQNASAAIVGYMNIGSKGANVTQLQQFLATNSAIYPQGTVTGYFGGLTKAAVVQFQLNYNIDPIGRVGPATLSKVNSIMSSGLGLDIDAPIITNSSTQMSTNSATINWSANESINGQVFYDTNRVRMDEGTGNAQLPYVSGTAVQNSFVGSSQSVSIQNLQSNTTYYYVIMSTDASGNITLSLPSTFKTN